MTDDPRWTTSAKRDVPTSKGRDALRVFAGLIAVATIAYATVELFELGLVTGLVTTGSILVAYLIVATILDWPRLKWSDAAIMLQIVFKFIVAIVTIIVSAVLGILDALFG